MKKFLIDHFLIILGWLFVLLAIIGVVLPILPTTPFLILALGLFSKSSPRFHQMLLDNRWFGPALKQWEETKTVTRKIKIRACVLIVITFSISIAVLYGRLYLQLMLVCIALILLFFIYRLREAPSKQNQFLA